MRLLPESLMILLTSAIVTGQCLQPNEQNKRVDVDADIATQESELAITQPTVSLAMTHLARFDDSLCPGRLHDDRSGLERSADRLPVAIMPPAAPEII